MSDLEELRRLSDAATPGPWRAAVGADSLIHRPDGSHMNLGDAIYHDRYAADATFIVALVNAYRDGSLSNPTSSVSTEGVADAKDRIVAGAAALQSWASKPEAMPFPDALRSMDGIRAGLDRLEALAAHRPDSPVEPDRG